ncbi:uncharacterized protein [Atheta coriaria]|uniref:uncharacterized protein n=1 Tax=Dalotia coriaria TaxID=877792 RepID=UPI0031F3F689
MDVSVKQDGGTQWRQIYSIITVCLNSITTGLLLSWTSPSIPLLQQEGVSMTEASYLTVIPPLTSICVSPFVGKLIDWIGRRRAVLSVTLSYTIAWLLIILANNITISPAPGYLPQIYIYYAARVFTGIGDACVFTTIPGYVTEIATPAVRGTWGNCISLSILFGQFLINLIGAYLSIVNTAYVCLLLPVVFLVNFMFIKESPYYLLMKGRVDDARSSLQWLRGAKSPAHVEEELIKLTSDVQRQMSETGRYYDLIKIKSNRKACLIGIVIRAVQQLSGISAFSYYSQTIFIESGSDLSPSMSAIVFTAILFICTFLASFVLDILGRRRAMLISCAGCSLVLFIQSGFFYIQDETEIIMEGFQVFPLISMVTYVFFYAIGLGLVPTLILGELFSSSVKSKAFVVMNMSFGISMASSAQIFAVCLSTAGLYAAFLFLAICTMGGIGVSYYLYRKQKGKLWKRFNKVLKSKKCKNVNFTYAFYYRQPTLSVFHLRDPTESRISLIEYKMVVDVTYHQNGKQWRQVYSILIVCLNTISTGQCLAWTSPFIPILRQQGVSMEEATYLSIIPPLTTIIASPLVGKLIDWIGRRPAILSVTLSYTIYWLLIIIAANATTSPASEYLPRPLYIYYAARVFNGIGDSCVFSTIPCYVTEITTPSVRGTWGNCISLSIFFGQFLMNIIGSYLSIANTAYVCLLLPLVFILNYFFIKETPYYLLMKGRVDDARSSLQWLRNTSATYVEEELIQLTSDVQRQMSETGRYYDLIKISSNRKACLIGILIRASQQFSGISAFSYYSQTIFIESGSDLSPSMSAIVFTGILFICTFFASFVLDYLGRRKAMLISCTGCTLVLFIQAAFFYIQDETEIIMEGFKVFPLISMVTYVLVYAIGLGLVPTLMLGELFSSSVKSKAFVVMNVFFGICIASSAEVFAVCLSVVGLYAAFLFLAICTAGSIGISYCVVPETKGKTLEEIQQGFKQ